MNLETKTVVSLAIAVPTMLAAGTLPYFAIKIAGAVNRARDRKNRSEPVSYNNGKVDFLFLRNYIG